MTNSGFRMPEGLTAAIGVWLFASPFVLPYTPPAGGAALLPGMGLFIIAGTLAIGISMLGLFHHSEWEPWAGLALGALVLAAPWLLGYSSAPVSVWNGIVSGGALVAAALWAWLAPAEVPQP